MSETQSEEETTPEPPRNPFVERAPIITGAVVAVVGIVAVFGLPWQFLLTAQLALAWGSLCLAVLALIAIERGRSNARAIVSIVLGAAGFAFWLAAPQLLGALPVYAYLVTAAVAIALGLLIGRIDTRRQRAVFTACAGAVVFIIVGVTTRLGS